MMKNHSLAPEDEDYAALKARLEAMAELAHSDAMHTVFYGEHRVLMYRLGWSYTHCAKCLAEHERENAAL